MPLDDIEGLKAKQAAHKAEQAEKTRKEQEAAKAEEELKASGGLGLLERDARLKEMKEVSEKVAEMRAQNIEQRIQKAEEIRLTKSQREEELSQTDAQLEDLMERISIVESLAVEEELAPDIKEELGEARTEATKLANDKARLNDEIAKLDEELISEELVQEYQQLVTRLSELEDIVCSLEQNPYVIELMRKEAKTENDDRRIVVDALKQAPDFRGDRFDIVGRERANYFSVLAQKFFQEEIDHSGINQIDDPEERQARMRELTMNLIVGLRDPDIYRSTTHNNKKTPLQKSQQLSGVALLNLAGKYGAVKSLTFLALDKGLSGGMQGRRRDRINWRTAAIEHIGSINYILSEADGYGPLSYDITTMQAGTSGYSNELRGALRDHGFEELEDGTVVPAKSERLSQSQQECIAKDEKPLPVTKIDELQKERATYLQDAEAFVEKYIAKEEQEVQQMIDSIKQLEQNRIDVERYESELKAIAGGKNYSVEALIGDVERELTRMRWKAEQLEQLYVNEQQKQVGFLDGRGKKLKQKQVEEYRQDLGQVRSAISDAESTLARAQELAEKYPREKRTFSSDVEIQVLRIEESLRTKRQKLDELKKAHEVKRSSK